MEVAPPARIDAFESLRGLMALWVVVGHAVTRSGYGGADIPPLLSPLASPIDAVGVFIVLSGFVIFFLLDRSHLSYGAFLTRRVFRLFPLYLAALAAAAASQSWEFQTLQTIPWRSSAIAKDINVHLLTLQYFDWHLLAHATMTHGLLSDALLPASAVALISQAWSLSLEWQFYLMAPALFLLVERRAWTVLAGVMIAMGGLASLRYVPMGFIANSAGLFVLGIASYYLWKRVAGRPLSEVRAWECAAAIAVVLVCLFFADAIPAAIWVAVFALVLLGDRDGASPPVRAGFRLLHQPLLLWLGRISYSVYVCHFLVLYAVIGLLLGLWPDIPKLWFALALITLTVGGTLAVATLTFRVIEQPGMALGQVLARKLEERRQRAGRA